MKCLSKPPFSVEYFWVIWLFCLVIIISIQLLTIGVAPFLHKDEFMIVDLGRIILDPNTDWAITWMTKSDSPVLLWSYIGPVFQELSFRTMGELGPRVMGLVGAVLAANAMLFYLLARGTSQTAALTLSLVFLLDPLFVQSYTMGRVDGWAIAFCITSCYVLTGSMTVLTKKQLKIQAFMAGGLGSVGFLIWPSAIFLFPLIVYQLLILCFERKSILAMAYFILGAVIIGFSLLLPISLRIYQQFDRVVDGLLVNLKHASDMPDSRLLNYFHSALELLRILKFTPFLVLFAFISVSRRKSGLILAAIATILLLLITLVYIHRVIYLLPVFIVSIALEYKLTGLRARKLTRFKAIARCIPLYILIIWSASLSLGIRTVLAEKGMIERKRDLVFKAATTLVGSGNYSVLSGNEFYYSGRSLGWKMYSPYLSVGEPISYKDLIIILPHVDYVILQTPEQDKVFELALKKEGFKMRKTYYVYESPRKKDDGVQTNIKRLRNVYSIFQKPYGPYKLYVRSQT